nr:MAG TPA: hypothetical protein [Caudoviricetes sp.]
MRTKAHYSNLPVYKLFFPVNQHLFEWLKS